MEAVLPVTRETNPAAKTTSQLDVLMMAQNLGGKKTNRT
jgi:hypothetical protein